MGEDVIYLMHPNLHAQLSCVRGFNKMNGERYQTYIIMNLGDKVSDDVKAQIIATRDDEEALKIVSNAGIQYTHDWNE